MKKIIIALASIALFASCSSKPTVTVPVNTVTEYGTARYNLVCDFPVKSGDTLWTDVYTGTGTAYCMFADRGIQIGHMAIVE